VTENSLADRKASSIAALKELYAASGCGQPIVMFADCDADWMSRFEEAWYSRFCNPGIRKVQRVLVFAGICLILALMSEVALSVSGLAVASLGWPVQVAYAAAAASMAAGAWWLAGFHVRHETRLLESRGRHIADEGYDPAKAYPGSGFAADILDLIVRESIKVSDISSGEKVSLRTESWWPIRIGSPRIPLEKAWRGKISHFPRCDDSGTTDLPAIHAIHQLQDADADVILVGNMAVVRLADPADPKPLLNAEIPTLILADLLA
jgi:hypothetical protein